ncbi:MAG TPA: threonine ammonia-lyase [Geminicoccus sp.]|uniref:threonine ammonia-lyase n=1 Tax=Geminicoccus sp. TaxID=2024832 RepID=UPI002E37E10E|nr:threonine ammonia-lyase [Geminicoccus sp.]HEX2525514.1 threonine ammonia-lyase [Geminicoccus sp.]
MTVTFDDVRAAQGRIAGAVLRTPCLPSRTLSEITGAQVRLKFENFQYTASFKERGALNRLLQISDAERRQGVIAMSAGNHAQGVAYHASRLGIPSVIVMPAFTPIVKVENTRKLGARVELFGASVEEAGGHAREIAAREGLLFVHPFDDAEVIAGQGSIACEMLDEHPDLEVLVVPIGGGGLIAGMATAAKVIAPDIEIIGVEAALYPSVWRLRRNLPIEAGGPTIAEGIAVKNPGVLTLPIIERLVDDVVLVDEAALETAVLMLLEIEKTVVEGAGAAGLAALLSHADRFRGRRVGLVLCGGNIDSRLLSAVILRGLVRTERLVRFRVSLPDRPGSLTQVTALIAKCGGNVVDVGHQRAFARISVMQTDVDVTIETRNAAHAAQIRNMLAAEGYAVRSLDEAPSSGGF